MPGRLQDKIAVVTGASSGIGRAICLAYIAEGAKVVCADIRESSRYESSSTENTATTMELIKKAGGEAIYVTCDTTKEEEVEALVKKAVEWGGRLDVMVNNAGVGPEANAPAEIWNADSKLWHITQAVNSTGVFYGCKHASAQMIKQSPHSSGDQGWIINLASILGLVASPSAPSYSASKAACVNLTKSAALACGPKRIHVNCICPGYARSAFTEELQKDEALVAQLNILHPFANRLAVPDDVAKIAVFLASELAQFVNGAEIKVDGGFTAQ